LFFPAVFLLMLMAFCGFALDFHVYLSIPRQVLVSVRSFISGLVLGLFVALIASQELSGKKIVKREIAA
jgi:hypothetical protein